MSLGLNTKVHLHLEKILGISESGYEYTAGYFEDWSGETYKQELVKENLKS